MFGKIEKGEPPAYVMEAWRKVEIQIGEALTHEEMAQVAALTLTAYFADIFTKHPEGVARAKGLIEIIRARKTS